MLGRWHHRHDETEELKAGEEIKYDLDRDDVIRRVYGDWSDVTGAVVGNSIWRYIIDSSLVEVYQHLFTAARKRGRPLEFAYRCDTPTHVQRMRLRVAPLGAEALEVRSRLVASAAKASPEIFFSVGRGVAMALKCSVCARLGRSPDWMDLVEAAQADWLDRDQPIRVYHSVCPACRDRLMSVGKG